jgi:hypothetical protein
MEIAKNKGVGVMTTIEVSKNHYLLKGLMLKLNVVIDCHFTLFPANLVFSKFHLQSEARFATTSPLFSP